MNVDFDASNSNAVAAAMIWIEATMLGGIATIAAVIAVAAFGLLLFLGRAPVPRRSKSRVGAFILFGASSIASGIVRSLNGSANNIETATGLRLPAAIEPTAEAQPPPRYNP